MNNKKLFFEIRNIEDDIAEKEAEILSLQEKKSKRLLMEDPFRSTLEELRQEKKMLVDEMCRLASKKLLMKQENDTKKEEKSKLKYIITFLTRARKEKTNRVQQKEIVEIDNAYYETSKKLGNLERREELEKYIRCETVEDIQKKINKSYSERLSLITALESKTKIMKDFILVN